jgi:hypothetical protein
MAQSATSTNNKSVTFSGKPKRLPKGAKKLAFRGVISPKQLDKMKGDPGER